MCIGRIYVTIGKDYRDYSTFNNMDKLIEAVAFSVKNWKEKPLVKDVGGDKISCLAQTKKYIAEEASLLIENINRCNDSNLDYMAAHVSKRQINRLMNVCMHKGYRVSCYALVILHIIYINISNTMSNELKNDLEELANLIHHIAEKISHGDGRNDYLVMYILRSHSNVDKEIRGGKVCNPTDFPAINQWW